MNSTMVRLFLKSSSRSFAVSIVNLLITVLVVRWFGSSSYATFIVDLSVISILLILIEVIPSNYSVFRIQDDPEWQKSLLLQTNISIVMTAVIVSVVGIFLNIIQDFSGWMVVYAGSFAVKRYLDIRLQSSGRIHEYMNLEVVASLSRLVIMAAFFVCGMSATTSIWASLALGGVVSQAYFFHLNAGELSGLSRCFNKVYLKSLIDGFSDYRSYYVGVVLKRLKDNLVPIASARVFSSPDVLAAFFLAYRGMVFASGQVRIIEAILNHRRNLDRIVIMSWRKKMLAAFLGQVVCIISSAMILLSSGMSELPWQGMLVLSFMIWPIAFFVVERSKAYSSFKAGIVNWSMVGYIAVLLAGSAILIKLNMEMIEFFALFLVFSEVVALLIIFLFKSDKTNA